MIDTLLSALHEIERHCPCGARPESLRTHPHVTGCPVDGALIAAARLAAQDAALLALRSAHEQLREAAQGVVDAKGFDLIPALNGLLAALAASAPSPQQETDHV